MMKSCRRVMLFAFFAGCVGIVLDGSAFDVLAQKLVRRSSTKSVKTTPRLTGGVQVLINEVDSSVVGPDTTEFIELKSAPNTSLAGFVLVLYNGDTDVSYRSIDLDAATTDANGFAIIGNATVPGVDITFPDSTLQNGPDAVALYAGDATSFPNGTAVTTANLVDAVVYDNGNSPEPELLVLLDGAGAVKIDENVGGLGETNSIQRCGSAARDGTAFVVSTPSANASSNGCPQRPVADMNGDGLTDFVIYRPGSNSSLTSASGSDLKQSRERRHRLLEQSSKNSVASGGIPLEWWVKYNNAPSGFSADFGDFFDVPVSADFDGDGTDDLAVWRSDAPTLAGFYSINSSDATLRFSDFGQALDDPAVVGDYDGDGIDDPAVFRCPALSPGQCYFFYRGSLNNPSRAITYIPWGSGTRPDWVPYPGDFNGDGKLDFCLQDLRNPPQSSFWLLNNGTFNYDVYQWGLTSDLTVPGDFDGDGRSDFTVRRLQNNDDFTFYTLERDGGVRIVNWGVFGDIEVPGDYDGDGMTDIAIYRWNAVDATFWILPSNGDPHRTHTFGLVGDEPLANFNVQ